MCSIYYYIHIVKVPHVTRQNLISGRIDICCPWIFYDVGWPGYLVPGVGAYEVVGNSFRDPVSALFRDQKF